jgi:hypothetical protein
MNGCGYEVSAAERLVSDLLVLGGVGGSFGLLGLDGDADFYCGAFGTRANVEMAAQVADAFAHAGNTYAGQLIARPKFRH